MEGCCMPGGPADPNSWYARAAADLTLARRALDPVEPLAELAAYHAQQCAEKYLKGFLVSRSISFRFVHDLGYLLGLCQQALPEFALLEEAAFRLARYASESRYPREDDSNCTVADAQEAIGLAQQIRDLVLAR